MQPVFTILIQYGYPALFLILMLGIVLLPVPDETLLTYCGYLIYTGRLHFGLTFLAGFSGSVCGISISYFLGLRYGRFVLTRFGKFIRLTPERITQTERQFDRFGPVLLSIGYFIPGLRHFTAVVAGMSGVALRRFALFAYAGAALWIATFLTLGYVVGERWEHTSELFHRYTLIAIGIATGIAVLGRSIFWLIRRRRLQ